MTKFGDQAKAYEPQRMKNIADLPVVSVDLEIQKETRKDRDNKEYIVHFATIEGEEYRVPVSVFEQLKAILEAKPELKTFKVTKTGDGLNTTYTVISLE